MTLLRSGGASVFRAACGLAASLLVAASVALGQAPLVAPVYSGAVSQGKCTGVAGVEISEDVWKPRCFLTNDAFDQVRAFYEGKIGPLTPIRALAADKPISPLPDGSWPLYEALFEEIQPRGADRNWSWGRLVLLTIPTTVRVPTGDDDMLAFATDNVHLLQMIDPYKKARDMDKTMPGIGATLLPKTPHSMQEIRAVVQKYGWLGKARFKQEEDAALREAAKSRAMARIKDAYSKGAAASAAAEDYLAWGTWIDYLAAAEKAAYRTLVQISESDAVEKDTVLDRERVMEFSNGRALRKYRAWKAGTYNAAAIQAIAATSHPFAEPYPGSVPMAAQGGKAQPCFNGYGHDDDVPVRVWCYLTNDPVEKVRAFYDSRVGPLVDQPAGMLKDIRQDIGTDGRDRTVRTGAPLAWVRSARNKHRRDYLGVLIESAAPLTPDSKGLRTQGRNFETLKQQVRASIPAGMEQLMGRLHTKSDFDALVDKYGWLDAAFFTRDGTYGEAMDETLRRESGNRGFARVMTPVPAGKDTTQWNIDGKDYMLWGTWVEHLKALEGKGYRVLIMIGEDYPLSDDDIRVTRDRQLVTAVWKDPGAYTDDDQPRGAKSAPTPAAAAKPQAPAPAPAQSPPPQQQAAAAPAPAAKAAPESAPAKKEAKKAKSEDKKAKSDEAADTAKKEGVKLLKKLF